MSEFGPSVQENKNEKFPESLSESFTLIKEYNDQFSAGEMLGRALRSGMGDPMPARSLKFSDVFNKTEHYLTQAGLSIESGLGTQSSVVLASDQEDQYPKEIRFNISDSEKFKTYLKSIDPSKVSELEIELLTSIPKSLTSQLIDTYKISNDVLSDHFYNFVKSVDTIKDEYERINKEKDNYELNWNVREMQAVRGALEGQYLKEYIDKKSLPWFHWSVDMTSDGYLQRYSYYSKFFKKSLANEHVKPFLKKIVGNILENIEEARKQLKSGKITSGSYTFDVSEGMYDNWNKAFTFVENDLKSMEL